MRWKTNPPKPEPHLQEFIDAMDFVFPYALGVACFCSIILALTAIAKFLRNADMTGIYVMCGILAMVPFALIVWGFIRAHRMRSGKMFGKGDRT